MEKDELELIRPPGSVTVECSGKWCNPPHTSGSTHFWVEALDPRLPDGPFLCEDCTADKPNSERKGWIGGLWARVIVSIATGKKGKLVYEKTTQGEWDELLANAADKHVRITKSGPDMLLDTRKGLLVLVRKPAQLAT